MIDGTWIFGGVEVQDRTKCFFVPVPNRTAKSLLGNILLPERQSSVTVGRVIPL